MYLLVNKSGYGVNEIISTGNLAYLLESAETENAFLVKTALLGKLYMQITDTQIKTGDHFNIGVSIEEGKEPYFFRYSGMEKINLREIQDNEHLHWKAGGIAFLATIEAVEGFLSRKIGHVPRVRDWVISALSQ